MASNAQKTPLVKSLNGFVDGVAQSAEQLIGKAVPAQVVSADPTGTIVTVKLLVQSIFTLPTVTCAVGYPPFVRFPLVGAMGVVFAVDYYTGGVTGLGGGTADLTPQANLSTLIFMATGNTGVAPTDNAMATVLYGPDGTILRDFGNNGPGINGSNVRIEIDGQGNVQMWGAKSLSTDVMGYGSRTTWMGGTTWQIDNYTQGATVVENGLPISPPQIPAPS